MRRSKFTEQQIVGMLKQHEAGMTMAEGLYSGALIGPKGTILASFRFLKL